MYRPNAFYLAIAFTASSLTILETLHAQGQQATLGQPTALPATNQIPANPAGATGQAPAQLGQPQQAVAPAQPAGAPFQLTAVEKQFVDQILVMWEQQSSKIKTFDCEFERWEYSKVWGPSPTIPVTKSMGQLTYSKPDKGSFHIKQIRHWQKKDASQTTLEPSEWVEKKGEVGERWVCDGQAVYQYNHDKKQLEVNPLPPNMRGTAIANGPLPFLFGAKAADLNNRYWIRSKQGNEDTIWLEAYPRRAEDAQNYHHVDIMLNRKTMLPTAMQVHEPNGQSKSVYMFKEPSVNGTLDKLLGSLFNAPRTPFGWKRVVHELPPQAPQAAQPQQIK